MNLTNTHDDEEAGITFGTATPFISKEYISSDNLETKQNERPLDSLSKEEFFSIMENLKQALSRIFPRLLSLMRTDWYLE